MLNANNFTADATTTFIVPIGGNSWVNNKFGAKININGLNNWLLAEDKISVYVGIEQVGELDIALKLFVPDGESNIRVSLNNTAIEKKVANREMAVINFGKVGITSVGYIEIILQGLSKSGSVYADVSDVVLSGSALVKGAVYVKSNHDDFFLWGRRGPSVHLDYNLPAIIEKSAEWFYNEVTVPVGNDVPGAFFMANGFKSGYFGMQVKSATERGIIFSIWSPFDTNDPNSIPHAMKVVTLKKGPTVHIGEFGNEGSGRKSWMPYPWEVNKTYAFLIRAQGDAQAKATVFTAYFKEKDAVDWMLIASFKRPESGHYLENLSSFLENFYPDSGNVTRKVYFGNQWLVDTTGNWYPISSAQFNADDTANRNYRKDYSGGTEDNLFYLRNCGFFNDFTIMQTNFTRAETSDIAPLIDFSNLP